MCKTDVVGNWCRAGSLLSPELCVPFLLLLIATPADKYHQRANGEVGIYALKQPFLDIHGNKHEALVPIYKAKYEAMIEGVLRFRPFAMCAKGQR
jgi:hypothetical protein